MRGSASDLWIEVELEPTWRARFRVGHGENEGWTPLADVVLETVVGAVLGRTDELGELYVEIGFDPGQLTLHKPGWKVAAWDGFLDGRRAVELDLHAALMRQADVAVVRTD